MKKKYVNNGKRHYTFSIWPVIAFGYYSQYFQYDKYNTQYFKTWYFLFFKLSSTQYLQEIKD